MNLPLPGDYIDIHNHGGRSLPGHFSVENLMAHENREPDAVNGLAYSFGIHPWHLTPESFNDQIEKVKINANHQNVIALGEAGFDRLRGPARELQTRAFNEQAAIAAEKSKPLFIHCVRAWDDLLAAHKRMMPSRPWIIHGFRGKRDLAAQLILKGMYISFWFDFVIRPESTEIVKSLPADRIFLETDGSGIDIKTPYTKVAEDMGISVEKLRERIFRNFMELFSYQGDD